MFNKVFKNYKKKKIKKKKGKKNIETQLNKPVKQALTSFRP